MVRLRVLALAAFLLAALFAFAPRALAAPTAVAPTAGKTVVVARAAGIVRIRLPGKASFKALRGPTVVPLRTIVDALRGRVRLTSADGSGVFYQGAFQVFEPKVAPAGSGKGRLTDLRLFGGNFSGCTRKLTGGSVDDKPIRRLWGNAKGRFRTKGRFAAATVRGTVWLTTDSCTGSGVTVRTGVVVVRDLVHSKTVVVPAGKSYDATVNVAPVNTAPPSIVGSPNVGQTLTVTPGAWTGTPAPTFTYQWQRCDAAGANCVDIGGATGTTYVVQATDAGATLRVRETATNAAGSASATSAATGVVASGPVNTVRPAITGVVAQGSVLTASVGTWTAVPAPAFAFQWQRCNALGSACVAIAGATAGTYTILSADVNSTLRVQVTATNSAGTGSASSPAVGPIRPAITIGDVSINEGNLNVQGVAVLSNFVFTVTLSAASTQDVTVTFATADSTADSKDYRLASGTLTIKAGARTGTITVVVTGDITFEPNDTFFVNLSNPVNATLLDAQAVGTIVNDDVDTPIG